MNDLNILANSNNEMQIEGDKQLIHLTYSVEFLTIKFDELKKERIVFKSKFLFLRLK